MRGWTGLLVGVLLFILLTWAIILYPDVFKPLRELGAPVPYCTFNSLAVGCEFSGGASVAQVLSIVKQDPVYALLVGDEPLELVNTLCVYSRSGGNVLAVVSDDDLASTLVSCGVKVHRGRVTKTVVVSPSGAYIYTGDLAIYSNCRDFVQYVMRYARGCWERCA